MKQYIVEENLAGIRIDKCAVALDNLVDNTSMTIDETVAEFERIIREKREKK